MLNRFFAPYNVLVVTCFGNFVIIFVCSFEEVTPGAMNKTMCTGDSFLRIQNLFSCHVL